MLTREAHSNWEDVSSHYAKIVSYLVSRIQSVWVHRGWHTVVIDQRHLIVAHKPRLESVSRASKLRRAQGVSRTSYTCC